MGLFSKLLKGSSEKKATQVQKPVVRYQSPSAKVETIHASYATTMGSCGPDMPDEPCQFNYDGTFEAYFESIFDEVLGKYRVEKQYRLQGRRVIYTFYEGEAELMIELGPKSSVATRVRDYAARNHIPYLRFYYNHEGWWNTRAYVIERIENALK